MKKILIILFISIIAFHCNNSSSNNTNEDTPSQNSTEATSTSHNAEQTVIEFINELGKQNFQQAYELTKNHKWGTFSNFGSEKSFGGISATKILETKLSESKSETATVFANVVYTDAINGSNQFQQNFYLQKYGNNWRIIDMKLIKKHENEQTVLGVYTNETVYLIVYAFDNGEDFKGVLLNSNNEFVEVGVYGVKTKKGYRLEPVDNKAGENSQRCSVGLTFNGDEVTLDNQDNCFNLNGTLTKTKDFDTPKAGVYGELEINNVSSYSFKFKVSVNEGSLSCTGEIGVDEYAIAYGINGVYVFYDYDFEGESGCLILITCKDKTVTFSEIGMCYYHGANCSFNGKYTME